MDDDLDGVIANIRACLISSKGPVPLRNLLSDYETLVGSNIPYHKFNYDRLESFLQSFSSLNVIGSGRDALVEARRDSSSSHISSLVAKQRSAKKRDYFPSYRRGAASRSSYGKTRGYPQRSYAPRETQYVRKPPMYTNQVPNYKNSESVGPLVVKLEGNDKRQVSLGDTSSSSHWQTSQKESRPKFEIPPRLQKALQNKEAYVPLPSPNEVCKSLEKNLYLGYSGLPDSTTTNSTSIISPLGPSQLIAAGRAIQEAAQAQPQHEEFLLQDPVLDTNFVQKPLVFDNTLDSLPEEITLPDVPVPKSDPVDLPSNVKLLLQYAIAKKWCMPDYKTHARKSKEGNGIKTLYGVRVKLCNMEDRQTIINITSYPYENENINIVKGYVAKLALDHIYKEEKVKNNKTIISTNKKIILDRIFDIVNGKDHGVFANKIKDMYSEKHNEVLPEDWMQILRSCPNFSIEANLNNFIIFSREPITEPVLHESLQSSIPDPVEHPLDNEWDVFVTFVTSTREVWFRVIGEDYSVKYEELLDQMDCYYKLSGTKELALNIEEGQCYAALIENGWLRVCVSEVKEEEKIVVAWLIDNGDTDFFLFTQLYRLPAQFCKLPRQAIQCALEGLEDLGDDPYANELVSNSTDLIGKSLIAKINYRDQDNKYLRVTLYDTSGADDVNINEKLQDSLIAEKADPVLPNEGCAMNIYIGSVSKRGDVYIQIPGILLDRITKILDSLGIEEINKHKLTSYRQVSLNKMYLAKNSKNDHWYRAVVTTTPSMQQNRISVRFVDYGNTETVSITDIADVENLPTIISHLPHQAKKVALHTLETQTLSNAEIAKLHSMLLGEEKIVVLKTIKLQEDPPVVEIFIKNEHDMLESVNSTIYLERVLCRPEEKQRISYDINTYKSNLVNYINGQGNATIGLKRPELDGDFEAVKVILVANPGHFFFTPLKHDRELESLMYQLQDYYELAAISELTKEEIVIGGFYVAQYTDAWYRVVVTGDSFGSKVPVRLCDFGDIVYVSESKLRELQPEFCELPFMAVKGKLAGVAPIHMDWSVEDCIRFQKLVLDKNLAALVIRVEDNFLNPMEMVVSLRLIDTSSENDEVISDILVDENRAIKIP